MLRSMKCIVSGPKRCSFFGGQPRGCFVDPFLKSGLVHAFFTAPFFDRQVGGENALQIRREFREFPIFRQTLFRHPAPHHVGHDLVAHVGDGFGHIRRPHELLALRVDLLALRVHHVVVFQHVLAHVEVARLDLLLRFLQGLVDPGMNDRLALLQAQPLQHPTHPVGAEDAHQVVFQRQEEARLAGIALASGAAAQLIVDAAALVAFGADDQQATGLLHDLVRGGDLGLHFFLNDPALRFVSDPVEFLAQPHFEIAAQLDVGAAAGHVGGDRHRARRPACATISDSCS